MIGRLIYRHGGLLVGICLLTLGAGPALATSPIRNHFNLRIASSGYKFIITINGFQKALEATMLGVDNYLRQGKNDFHFKYRLKKGAVEASSFFTVRLIKQRIQANQLLSPEELFSFQNDPSREARSVWTERSESVSLDLRSPGPSVFILNASSVNCEIEVLLNGNWPKNVKNSSSSAVLDPIVLQSENNRITVFTRAILPEAMRSEGRKGNPSWKVTLMRSWYDGAWEPQAHLEVYEAKAGQDRQVVFDIRHFPKLPMPSYERAGDLTAEDKKKLRMIVAAYHEAYRTGDAEWIFRFERESFMFFLRRLGRSEDNVQQSAGRLREKLRRGLGDRCALRSLPEDLRFELIEGLVKVSAGDPIISGQLSDNASKECGMRRGTLYFGKKEGEWKLVRHER